MPKTANSSTDALELKNEIIRYAKDSSHQYAIAIEGDWGTGKTTYIKHEIIPELKKEGMKPIRISLFGVSNANELYDLLSAALLHVSNGKGRRAKVLVKEGARNASNLARTATACLGFPVTLTTNSKSVVEFIASPKHVFIIDDIERRREAMDSLSLFGALNNLIESNGSKLILVSNCIESLSSEKPPLDPEVREKLIWRTYKFTPSPTVLAQSVFKNINKESEDIDIDDCICVAAEKAQCNNARAMLRAQEFIEHVCQADAISDSTIAKENRESALVDAIHFALLKSMEKEPHEPDSDSEYNEHTEGLTPMSLRRYHEEELYKQYRDFCGADGTLVLNRSQSNTNLNEQLRLHIVKNYPNSSETIALEKILGLFKQINELDDEDIRPSVAEFGDIIRTSRFQVTHIEKILAWNTQLRDLGFDGLPSREDSIDSCKRVIDSNPSSAVLFFSIDLPNPFNSVEVRDTYLELKQYSNEIYASHISDNSAWTHTSIDNSSGDKLAEAMQSSMRKNRDFLLEYKPASIANVFFSSLPTGQEKLRRLFNPLELHPFGFSDKDRYKRWLQDIKKELESHKATTRLTAMRKKWFVDNIDELINALDKKENE